MQTPRVLLVKIVACLLLSATTKAAEPSVERVDLWKAGGDGYASYRIPALVVCKSGCVLAFCEARKNGRHDTGKIDLVLRRSTDGGRVWSDQQIVWSDDENTCGNPCAVVDQSTGVVWLLMTHNLGLDREDQLIAGRSRGARTAWVTSSSDDGATWAKPVEITATVKRPDWAWYATGPGVGIQLQRGPHAGRLVIPCDHIIVKSAEAHAHVIFSDDHGKSWQLGGVAGPETNECQVVELSDGKLLLNMRNHRNTHRERAVTLSNDGGSTWSETRYDAALPEPICQASLIRVEPDKSEAKPWLLFSNPADQKKRIGMTVRLSRDDGATWPVSKPLETGSSAYSSLAFLGGGRFACLYERDDYKQITLATFDREWLLTP